MIKLNKVTLKQAEAAVRNIHRKTPVLESLFDKVIFHSQIEKKTFHHYEALAPGKGVK